MGMFSSEDTVQGTIVNVEVKAFRNMDTFVIGMPKIVTLIQIRCDDGNEHLAYLSGEVSKLQIGQKIVCTIKKTWNSYWVYRTNGFLTIRSPQFTIDAGKMIYRKINQYEIVNR